MKNARKPERDFKEMLMKYINIKGLDIVVVLQDGTEVELLKNRSLIDDELISAEKGKGETRIKISQIKSVDLFAA